MCGCWWCAWRLCWVGGCFGEACLAKPCSLQSVVACSSCMWCAYYLAGLCTSLVLVSSFPRLSSLVLCYLRVLVWCSGASLIARYNIY